MRNSVLCKKKAETKFTIETIAQKKKRKRKKLFEGMVIRMFRKKKTNAPTVKKISPGCGTPLRKT